MFYFVSQAIFILVMQIIDSDITKLNLSFLLLICFGYTFESFGNRSCEFCMYGIHFVLIIA